MCQPSEPVKLLHCHNKSFENGSVFFHFNCLKYKRMPNNSQTTWICPSCCKKVKVTHLHKDVTFVQTLHTTTEKYKFMMSLGDNKFDIILSTAGWLNCAIIHEAQILLANVNNITGFQRPTLGLIGQFDIVTSDFVQVLHVKNNHWVCVRSINYSPGNVNLINSP